MSKSRLRDIVILLPGIAGSVLQKDGKDRWAISGTAFWKLVKALGKSVDQLALSGDDPAVDDLGDGIRATRLMPDAHLVPGLVKIDGYSRIAREIAQRFDVVSGTRWDEQPANFIEFPYDWRRDNRVAARQLKDLVDRRLAQWRKFSGAQDAKAILMTHSMGGLVARHYLEVLGGWRDCRALITFGTPFRGSLNALGFLANGFKRLFVDLTEVMRSFTSVYQLLPIYPAVHASGTWQRVAELEAIPHVDRARAKSARAFHQAIEDAVNTNRTNADYLRWFKTLPVVGTRQPTIQSARLDGGTLELGRALPDGVHEDLKDGDGTVPRLSAIPIELSDEYRDTFIPERHGSLQNSRVMLDNLLERITQMQVTGLGNIRGPEITPSARQEAAISLDLEDAYVKPEPVVIRAGVVNPSEPQPALVATVTPVDPAGPPRTENLQAGGGAQLLEMRELPPGLYRVQVSARRQSRGAPPPVHDLFEVA